MIHIFHPVSVDRVEKGHRLECSTFVRTPSYKISWALLEVMASLRQGSLQVIYLKVVIYFGKA